MRQSALSDCFPAILEVLSSQTLGNTLSRKIPAEDRCRKSKRKPFPYAISPDTIGLQPPRRIMLIYLYCMIFAKRTLNRL